MKSQQLQRAQNEIIAANCDFALLSSLSNVTYASGYEVPVNVGALAEMSFGTAVALIGARDESYLITPNSGAGKAREQSWLDARLQFETFDSFDDIDSRASFTEVVRASMRAAGLENSSATIGVEGRTMPHAISELLTRDFPNLKLVEIDGAMQKARSIKTPREIELLRNAAHIGDIGHRTLANLCRESGKDEFEMWSEITSAMNRAVGTEIVVTGELVTGPRSSVVLYPNGPKNRVTQSGDAALMDISGRVNGYWFDVSNTHIVGRVLPTATQKRFAKASQDACEGAMSALKPGARASDAAEAARVAFEKHGLSVAHYSGHQIGVAVNELPRLVPYDHTEIEVGMVFSVEPGAYEGEGGSFGARSEKMVLVTETGPEIISDFDWGIA